MVVFIAIILALGGGAMIWWMGKVDFIKNRVQPIDIRYKVQSGNNLMAISRIFDVPILDIKSWNGIKQTIRTGQTLILKNVGVTPCRYPAQAGEYLADIAAIFAVDSFYIKFFNGLTADIIPADQELIIYQPHFIRYRIRAGDTLSKIGDKFKISVFELKQSNHLDGDFIKAGDYIRIYREFPDIG